MANYQDIDITWGSATNANFERYLPIKVPIYKGLIGWRLALIKQSRRNIFVNVSTLDGLRKFSLGQKLNWADYKIYKENDFTITSGSKRTALAEMLARERFDFFPRSVIEVAKELNEFTSLELTLDPHLLIRYKSAFVFYVAKNNIELAKILTDGLYKAKADGSFDRLFEGHFKELFERLNLPGRRVIQLNNPFLPEEILDIDDHFWISPKAIGA
jgi:hypothetical protein